jgi:proline racemase
MNFTSLLSRYQHVITTIDSHTMGESTRIITGGFPRLQGKTMMEKKRDLEQRYDTYRRALMLEPRGHRDMFGAVLTEPTMPEADFGVIFLDNNGCLNMCGHGSIGVATVAVETGLVKVTEPFTDIVLEAPSGLIRTRVTVQNGRAEEASILNVPSFLYKKNASEYLEGYGTVPFDIAFGGNFFAIVDGEKLGLKATMDNLEKITDIGVRLLESIKKNMSVRHPFLDITSVDLAEFSFIPDNPAADRQNVVIFGDGQVDRSPCGTGTSAKAAEWYEEGLLQLHQPFIHESLIGSLFKCEAVEEVLIGKYRAIIPRITGSAWITGFNTWVIDEHDPFRNGFIIGEKSETVPV